MRCSDAETGMQLLSSRGGRRQNERRRGHIWDGRAGGLAGSRPGLQCNPTDNKPSGTSIILCGAAQPLPRATCGVSSDLPHSSARARYVGPRTWHFQVPHTHVISRRQSR